jgi:hypothetical protein
MEVADLVAFMLDAFLDGDADFWRASRSDPAAREGRAQGSFQIKLHPRQTGEHA